uniref:Uncharacterized protein n=1 Tax=Arundo donax TaxID=35708 RepID=A0A0A9FBP0_ARUDO
MKVTFKLGQIEFLSIIIYFKNKGRTDMKFLLTLLDL